MKNKNERDDIKDSYIQFLEVLLCFLFYPQLDIKANISKAEYWSSGT